MASGQRWHMTRCFTRGGWSRDVYAPANIPARRRRRGIYRGQPAGVPTWSGFKQSERLDIRFMPRWA